MSRTPGEFDETRLLQVRDLADRMLLDSRIKQQFIPKMDVFNYMQSLQNPSLNVKFNERAKKDYDVEIHWMNACSDFELQEDVNCVRGGEELSTNAQTYSLTNHFTYGFSVREEEFRDNEHDFQEAIAKGMLRIDKQITEAYCQYLVGQLNTFSGVNQVTNGRGSIDPIDGTITNIDPADWTAEVMAYFSRVMQMNRFDNAALLTGSNLYETLIVAAANNANVDDKGDYILWGRIPIYNDLFNVDSVNDPDLMTYMVSPYATAQVSKAFNPDYMRYFDHAAYTEPSRFMPGLSYDVWYDNSCYTPESQSTSVRYNDMVLHNWKIRLNAELFQNPFGCNDIGGDDNTGVLRFRNIDPAAVVTPTPTPTPTQ